MKKSLITLVIFVIFIHVMFFTLEAVLWMQPFVHDQLLDFLANPVTITYPVQALTLKKLFINQGFYNLFLLMAGVSGLYLAKGKQMLAGYALILFFCFCAIGAGIVLAATTRAYLLAFFQSFPAAIAFYRILPLYRKLANQ